MTTIERFETGARMSQAVRHGDTVFLVLKTVRYEGHEEVIEVGEVMLFLGRDFLVTVRHGEGGGVEGPRDTGEGEPRQEEVLPVVGVHDRPGAGVGRVDPGREPDVHRTGRQRSRREEVADEGSGGEALDDGHG